MENSLPNRTLFDRKILLFKIDEPAVNVRYIGLTEYKNCPDSTAEWTVIRETKASGVTTYEFPSGNRDPVYKWSERATLFSGSSLSPSQTLTTSAMNIVCNWI